MYMCANCACWTCWTCLGKQCGFNSANFRMTVDDIVEGGREGSSGEIKLNYTIFSTVVGSGV